MTDQPQNVEPNSVVILRRDGQWRVRVVENGRIFENAFHLEAHASAYADGQRMRLGIFPGIPPMEIGT